MAMHYERPTKYGSFDFTFGVYNVYNRRNSYYISTEYEALTDEISYQNVSIILILPYFNLQFSIFERNAEAQTKRIDDE